MTAPARISQADIERTAKAARNSGWPCARMVVDLANQRIEVFLSEAAGKPGDNDWDQEFDNAS